MEYQVYKKDNNELIAWFDTDDGRFVAHRDYDVITGNSLSVTEVWDELQVKVKLITHDGIDAYPDAHFKFAVENVNSDWIDLISAAPVSCKKGEVKVIPLGVAIQLPKGYEALLIPRSSTTKNYHIIQANSVGLIDESYCGDDDEWGFLAYAIKDTYIPAGVRLCQFRIFKHQPQVSVEVVKSLGNFNRGGFGSTGI